MKRILLALAAILLFASAAYAQQSVKIVGGSGGVVGVTSGGLNVNATLVPAGTQDVNLAQTGGAAVAKGAGTAASALRVELPTDGTGRVTAVLQTTDPCQTPGIAKSSKAISVTSATTTSLVAVNGSTAVFACGFAMTIAPSATSADTAAFEYGTGAACTSPTLLTGTFGNGDLTTTTGVAPISYGGGGQTIMTAPASNGLCILTAGTTVNVQGVLTYVQQ